MRVRILLLTGILLLFGVGFIIMRRGGSEVELPPEAAPTPHGAANPMKIESPAFQHNTVIPRKYTCDADPPSRKATDGQGNINPPLAIAEVTAWTKSLVLIMDDPDAPRGALRPGSGQAWVHWTMWNISPETTSITENSVPAGAVEGVTSFGKPGYGGPCPPSGTHRYFFKLYALDTMLELPPSADRAQLEEAMTGHILAEGELVGLYQRQ